MFSFFFLTSSAGEGGHIVVCWPAPYYVNPPAGGGFAYYVISVASNAIHIVVCWPAHYYVIRVAGNANHIVGKNSVLANRKGRGPTSPRRGWSHSSVLPSTLLCESRWVPLPPYQIISRRVSTAGGGRGHIVVCCRAHYYVNPVAPP